MPRSKQKSKANDLGNKKHATPQKIEQGFFSNWCDADADTDSSKKYVDPHPTGGRHYQNRLYQWYYKHEFYFFFLKKETVLYNKYALN